MDCFYDVMLEDQGLYMTNMGDAWGKVVADTKHIDPRITFMHACRGSRKLPAQRAGPRTYAVGTLKSAREKASDGLFGRKDLVSSALLATSAGLSLELWSSWERGKPTKNDASRKTR